MPSLKALKQRIHSVQSTRKITAAMKMVATSYYRRYQSPLSSVGSFYNALETCVGLTLPELPLEESLPPLLVGRPNPKQHLIVAIGSGRGLCGSFNGRLLTFILEKTQQYQQNNQDVSLLCLGPRLFSLTTRLDAFQERTLMSVDYKNLNGFSSALSRSLQTLFAQKQIDGCSLLYSRHVSALRYEPCEIRLFPLALNQISSSGEKKVSPIFGVEPDPVSLLKDLAEKRLETALYLGLMESKAAEESTRMVAMENATKNADDMIRQLNIEYNRTHQAYITKELIEIISGAEAI